jgi:hypothetical protein
MGPIDKWKRYRRVPWKMMIQILLIVLVTIQILLFTWGRQRYFQSQGIAFAYHFLPANYLSIEDGGQGLFSATFSDMENVLLDIVFTTRSYFTIADTSVDTILYLPNSTRPEDSNSIRPIVAEIELLSGSPRELLASSKEKVGYYSIEKSKYIHDECN